MSAIDVMGSMAALLGSEPDVADSFLIAAVYCRAIREDDTPRNVVEALYKALPNSNAWPTLRDAIVAALNGEEPDTEEEPDTPR